MTLAMRMSWWRYADSGISYIKKFHEIDDDEKSTQVIYVYIFT